MMMVMIMVMMIVLCGVDQGPLTSIIGASWLSGSVRDLQARDRGFDPRLD